MKRYRYFTLSVRQHPHIPTHTQKTLLRCRRQCRQWARSSRRRAPSRLVPITSESSTRSLALSDQASGKCSLVLEHHLLLPHPLHCPIRHHRVQSPGSGKVRGTAAIPLAAVACIPSRWELVHTTCMSSTTTTTFINLPKTTVATTVS